MRKVGSTAGVLRDELHDLEVRQCTTRLFPWLQQSEAAARVETRAFLRSPAGGREHQMCVALPWSCDGTVLHGEEWQIPSDRSDPLRECGFLKSIGGDQPERIEFARLPRLFQCSQ